MAEATLTIEIAAPAIFEGAGSILLNDNIEADEIRRWLEPAGFSDCQAAYRCLQRLAREPKTRQKLAELLPQLLLALSEAADPNHVLVNFERFTQNAPDPIALFHDFGQNPRTLEMLVLLFSGSQFLTEILLRHPHYFTRLTAHQYLTQQKSAAHFQREAQAAIAHMVNEQGPFDPFSLLDALRRFQRWELLRIGTSDLLGSFDLSTVTSQLSYLADSLVEAALTVAAHQTQSDPADFFVIGLGKLGGEELNYSSDIDLLFLAQDNAPSYWPLGQRLIDVLGRTTAEGFLYRVDMRLRPWGSTGALVSSVAAYLTYLQKHAGLWEKQALLKARVIAGNKSLGQKFLDHIQPFLFDNNEATIIRAEIHVLKQRIEGQLHKRGQQWGEVKLGQGSIRDIEFVTQYLQLAHGEKYPTLRTPNTLTALARLSAEGFLTPEAYRILVDGYTFLRTTEHHLQLMHYQQTHQLPTDPKPLNHLAQRLGFRGSKAGSEFVARYEQHSAVIRIVYKQYLGDKEPKTTTPQANTPPIVANLLPHLARMPLSYITAFSEAEIEHHATLVEQLDQDNLVKVEAKPLDETYWEVTLVGYDYLGQLSLICGLLFVYGFNIVDGKVFSYGPAVTSPTALPQRHHRKKRGLLAPPPQEQNHRRKIVDVFTVRRVQSPFNEVRWQDYAADLNTLVKLLHENKQREAQGELAKRVAVALRDLTGLSDTLYPIDIEIDNESSERHTILRIETPDTIGFLYEFTNALALHGINIRRVTVNSVGNRVQDTLYVTDTQHHKITAPHKQRELRVATALIKHFTHLLPQSPNPELALLHFREFVGQLFTRPNWPDELTSLEKPEVLNTLARLLGVSDFLWNDFLRMQYENLFPVVRDTDILAVKKAKADLQAELETLLQQTPPGQPQRDALNAFKDREMFRIDMRQIQAYLPEFGQFSDELTDLAEVVVEAAYHLAARDLQATFGLPRMSDGRSCPVSVCALGKCGGRELGFASDIELMFLYAANGQTSGPRVITTAEFFNKLVQEVSYIIQARQEGIFELDLRLRPYGKAGNMAVSLDSFRRYFAGDGDAWPYERQALVRLRPIAGDEKFGREMVKVRDALIYTGDPFDIAAMRAMRERQLRHLVTAGTVNAKFSPGGLVDVEYLVQGLQITHGHHTLALRQPNTHEAMRALVEANILAPADYFPLHEAHIFLRRLINALRVVRGDAKELTVPPAEGEEFAFLARRLDYSSDQISQLWADLIQHTTTVQEINSRLLG